MLILIYFLIAVGISFLCSILEAVLLSISPSFIEVVKQDNEKLGSLMFKQKEDLDSSIGAILTLNTFAHTLGAAGVGAEAVKLFGQEYMFYVSAVLTILILVFSEIIPKTLGAYYWKSLSKISTHIIRYLVFITYPLLFIMKKITAYITPDKKEGITKEEIAAVANIAEANGVLKEKETDMIENLLNLGDIKIKDIHTPRSVLFCVNKQELLLSLSKNQTKLQTKLNLDKFKEYSRIPIYDKNIDDIVGIVISKEYLLECIENKLDDKNDIIKPVYKISENISISKLLDLFISRKEHLFIVTDDYGQTEGIVTLEDALETLLGVEIVDELDRNVDMREVAKTKMKLLRKEILNKLDNKNGA